MLTPNSLLSKSASSPERTYSQAQLNEAVLLIRDATRIEATALAVSAELTKQRDVDLARSLAVAAEPLSAALDRLPPPELTAIREKMADLGKPLQQALAGANLPDRLRTSTAAAVSYVQLHSGGTQKGRK